MTTGSAEVRQPPAPAVRERMRSDSFETSEEPPQQSLPMSAGGRGGADPEDAALLGRRSSREGGGGGRGGGGASSTGSTWKRDLVTLGGFILVSAAVVSLTVCYFGFGNLSEDQWAQLCWPTSLENVKHLASLLAEYSRDNFFRMAVSFSLCFLFVQSFFIPVSTLLNLLAGAWFGAGLGTFICVLCTAIGSTVCYLVSKTLGGELAERFVPDKLQWVRRQVANHASDQVSYLTFFFVMPGPHTLMKVAAPHIGVPMANFFPAVFLGLIPYNLIVVRTGLVLSQIQSKADIFNWSNYAQLAGLALCGFLLPHAMRKLKAIVRKEQ